MVVALLGPERREEVPFHVVGSSLFGEMTSHARETTTLPMRTCDEVVCERGLDPVDMIKLDVQGAELQVLEGARRALESVQVLFLEVAVLEYNRGVPLFADVVRFLDERGFVLYDAAALHRAPNDSLSQCDLIFARADSPLRRRLLEEQLQRGAPRAEVQSGDC